MKILLVNKYGYLKGGSETVFFTTLELLRQANHEVTVVTIADPKNVKNDDIKSYELDYKELSNSSLADKLKGIVKFIKNDDACNLIETIIKENSFDIVHLHLIFNSFSIKILDVFKKYNIPVVYTAHDYRLICPAYILMDSEHNLCTLCKDKKWKRCFTKKCSNGSLLNSTMLTLEMYYRNMFFPLEKYIDKIICVSDFSKDMHSSFLPDCDKLISLYNPVIGTPERSDNKEDYFLYFGRLSREKGVDFLISVFRKYSNLKLKIAGTGDLELIKDLPSNIEYLGYKNQKELKPIIQKAKFTIVPSMWNETFGLIVVESFLNGTPVIVSNRGGLTELVDDDKNGYIFESGNLNSLSSILEKMSILSEEDYNYLVHNALQTSSKFSGDVYLNKLLNIYTDIAVKY